MITVKQLLKGKEADCVCTIAPQDTVYNALEIMAGKNIGALVVVEKEEIVGMVSERDYARGVVLKGRSSKDTSVSELMDGNVCYVRPEQTIEECMVCLRKNGYALCPSLKWRS